MELEDTVQTEQAEATGTPEAEDTAFETGWDDDGQPDYGESVTTEEESEETEADADQQDAEGTEGESDGADTKGEAEGDAGNPDQGETFTLRHLGEQRSVNREEVITLAQKGMDYDRIREDRDRLRVYENFLKELADSRGSDIESLIDETRTRALMARAEANGEKLDPAAAAAQAVRARMQAQEKDEAEEEVSEEDRKRNDGMISEFLEIYGESVKPEDIPQEVWTEAAKTGSLTVPYQRYLNRKLEEENKRLKTEIEQAKQQRKNRERSTGSSKSEGSAAAKDSFDEGWDGSW